MSDSSPPSGAEERFIAAAIRPLGDNAEMQMMAGLELRHALEQGKIEPQKVAALAKRLESANGDQRLHRWFYGAVALVSVVALGLGIQVQRRWESACFGLFGMSDPITGAFPHLPLPRAAIINEPDLLGDFTPDQEELLFGSQRSPYGREFESLSKRYPEDPAIFAEHAKRLSASDELPGNFIETADRIDPDNGWFRYFAAGCAARKAVDLIGNYKPPRYRIKDPALLDEALELMKEAAELPKFDSYRDEILLRRLAELPPGDDFLGRLFLQEYATSEGGKDHGHRATGHAIGAKAEQLAAKGEAEEFRKLCQTQQALAIRVIENAKSTTLDSLWAALVLKLPSPLTMSKAAKDLGLNEEERHYQRIEENSEKVKKRRESRRTEELHARSSTISRRTRWDAFSAEPIDLDELKPALRAEHALLDRFLSYVGWLVFLLASGLAALCRFRHGKQARLLSLSLLKTLGTKDHLWIMGAGTVFPFGCYLAAEHVPLFAGTDWSVHSALPGNGVRLFATIALMLSLPVAIATWRLALHFGEPPKRRWTWPGKIALAAAIAAWLCGAVMTSVRSLDAEFTQAGIILAGIPVAYYFVGGLLRVLVRDRSDALRGLLLSRATIPAYISGMLLMAIATFLFRAEEKAWISKDTLTKIDPSVPAESRFDHETAMQIRADSLEILSTEEEPRE